MPRSRFTVRRLMEDAAIAGLGLLVGIFLTRWFDGLDDEARYGVGWLFGLGFTLWMALIFVLSTLRAAEASRSRSKPEPPGTS